MLLRTKLSFYFKIYCPGRQYGFSLSPNGAGVNHLSLRHPDAVGYSRKSTFVPLLYSSMPLLSIFKICATITTIIINKENYARNPHAT